MSCTYLQLGLLDRCTRCRISHHRKPGESHSGERHTRSVFTLISFTFSTNCTFKFRFKRIVKLSPAVRRAISSCSSNLWSRCHGLSFPHCNCHLSRHSHYTEPEIILFLHFLAFLSYETVTENQIAVVCVSYIVRNYSAQLGFVFYEWSVYLTSCEIILHNWALFFMKLWARGGAVGWVTALQVERSRVRSPMVSLEFFLDIIVPPALWPWGWLSL